MKEMTPKERVMAFFRHEPVDELPTDEGIFVLFNPEAYKERPSHEHGGVDWFGVPWKYESSVDAIAPDHSVEPIMEDICDWRELVKFPDLDAWDWSKVEEIDHISEIDRENKVFEIMFVNGPFERLHMLMGFENALCALLTDPEEVEEFFNTYMEWKIKLMEKVIEYYKPDVLMFHDDWGTQNNMFFSPDVWRSLIFPQECISKSTPSSWQRSTAFLICGLIRERHTSGIPDRSPGRHSDRRGSAQTRA